ncbi:NtaA/DmoA family FMN-dependent monooxygenase [Frankia sp. AiPs1]|uniref:NtaA/DmoA family FMN-dependent monooxygenase n=1 Tax=Frankia sp. AiPs1 TaxID=573493 RepID=UPI0020441C6A|nr:NtaA/DmoA family FMN-dependent monooxygenase [Frankia sp. AiPs1]MCM3925084.1 NtaA/DmoA family FMN-dependent monooxygenase [Frankia sp. AiPs1]
MFHLGWFVGGGFGPQAWNSQWSGTHSAEWMRGGFYAELARSLERACFDYLILEDGLMITDAYRGSMEVDLKYAWESPRLDPMAAVAVMSQATSRIGLVATLSTSFYPPFMAARMLVSLDHLSAGRVGANLVTSSSHRSAQNFGFDEHFEHDLRYEMADEWMDLVDRLCASWEPQAVVTDQQAGVFADFRKVHTVDFAGRFHRSRGPLNAPAGPQGRPVICQAGGSPAGREFAARHSDTIIAVPHGIEGMKAYREDVSARMIRHGRKPSDCKVLFLVNPIIGETDDQARELLAHRRARQRSPELMETVLAQMSYFSGIDFAQFDLDGPFPDLTGRVNGHQSSMTRFANAAAGRTLRETVMEHDTVESVELVGSPDTVAAQMGEVMAEVGGDGFLIATPVHRRVVAEIADGLVPALQRRGLMRTSYPHELFRDNLLEF